MIFGNQASKVRVERYDKKIGRWLWEGDYIKRSSAESTVNYLRSNGERVRVKALHLV